MLYEKKQGIRATSGKVCLSFDFNVRNSDIKTQNLKVRYVDLEKKFQKNS